MVGAKMRTMVCHASRRLTYVHVNWTRNASWYACDCVCVCVWMQYFTMTNAIMHNIRPQTEMNAGWDKPSRVFCSGSSSSSSRKKTISSASGGVGQTPLNLDVWRACFILLAVVSPAVGESSSPLGKTRPNRVLVWRRTEQMVELISKTCSKWIRE